jgi:lipopolysaccharide transport protein LptA
MRIEANKLNVAFDGTNEVKQVTAMGSVRLWHEDKRASCRKAIYIAKTGEVILQGNAKVAQETGTVMGDEITFSLHNDTMESTGATLIIESEHGGLPDMVPSRKALRK